jgi:hypothetical protein
MGDGRWEMGDGSEKCGNRGSPKCSTFSRQMGVRKFLTLGFEVI